MGTNYYWTKKTNVCDCCGRADVEEKHIGKSSGGWTFGLHVYPSEGINTLEDWEARFPEGEIRTEYNETLTPAQMSEDIRNRSRDLPLESRELHGLRLEEYLERNYAVEGPNNLMRRKIDLPYGHCIGHGEGTWDYLDCEFS